MPVAPGKAGMHIEMDKFKSGTLHSGSPTGPIVKSRKQAIAISLKESGLSRTPSSRNTGNKPASSKGFARG